MRMKISGHLFNEKLLSPEPWVVDAGAHSGKFALPFVEKFGGRCFCLEPNPNVGQELEKAQDENPGQIVLIRAALWPRSGEHVPMNVWDNTESSSLLNRPKKGTPKFILAEVETVCLDDIAPEREEMDLLKMDIEGSEFPVILEAGEQLRRFRQVCGELHFDVETLKRKDIARRFVALGFVCSMKSRRYREMLFAVREE